MKKRLLRIGSSGQKTGASALQASASAPASGITFVDNSRGASAAVAELSAALDSALDQADFTADLDEGLSHLVHKLDQQASTFSNSKLDDSLCAEWACSQAKAQTVSVAWRCALGVYDLAGDLQSPPYCSFQHELAATPSMGGSRKALATTIVRPTASDNTHEFLPALVIAVRGSASKVDHMVNANAEPRNASDLIGRPIDAHSGFLNSAKALDDIVSEKIRLYTQAHPSSEAHIIFTGHSAGGAVASLLFLRHLLNNPDEGSAAARLSCITFGSPPVVTTSLELGSVTLCQPRLGLCLNIVNEFDVVTRADKPYMLSLVNLLRSMYEQPPLAANDEDTGGSISSNNNPMLPSPSTTGPADRTRQAGEIPPPPPPATAAGHGNTQGGEQPRTTRARAWPVPPLLYHHVGSRVLFMMRLDGSGEPRLKAVEVHPAEFAQLLFCRVAVHRRACYSERMQRLEAGELG